jgi:hypothetical protein
MATLRAANPARADEENGPSRVTNKQGAIKPDAAAEASKRRWECSRAAGAASPPRAHTSGHPHWGRSIWRTGAGVSATRAAGSAKCCSLPHRPLYSRQTASKPSLTSQHSHKRHTPPAQLAFTSPCKYKENTADKHALGGLQLSGAQITPPYA